MEKKNIIAGSLLIAGFLFLGGYLQSQLGAGELWKMSARHAFWKIAHVHGLGIGILNILYGLILKNYSSNSKILNMGSILAALGTLMPVALFLAGIQPEFKFLSPLGGFSMILAWITLAYFMLVKK